MCETVRQYGIKLSLQYLGSGPVLQQDRLKFRVSINKANHELSFYEQQNSVKTNTDMVKKVCLIEAGFN